MSRDAHLLRARLVGIHPRRELLRREVREGEHQVRQVALRIDRNHRDAVERQRLAARVPIRGGLRLGEGRELERVGLGDAAVGAHPVADVLGVDVEAALSDAERLRRRREWLGFLAISMGSFIAILDIQIVASSINVSTVATLASNVDLGGSSTRSFNRSV
mgnify:CR=1 FL=1